MVMNTEFWHGKRVFLTGHTGFKGSWLSLWLQTLGAEITGFALPPPDNQALFIRARVADGMTSIHGDIRDLAALETALKAAQPDVVIHMAAQALVRVSYEAPIDTFATNVIGTAHVFEAIRRCLDVRAVVNVTSDKCYENREWLWGYRENEALGGHDPYSASKACAEIVGSAMRASFFPPESSVAIASARAGNVIGGGDTARDRLIPDLVTAFAADRPAVIRNPLAIRPWQHVLEPLAGYLLLAEKLVEEGPRHAEAWNFGPRDQDMLSVGTIADAMAARWGNNARWMQDQSSHPHEAHTLRLDATKARLRLGWQPQWTLDQALDSIVTWHQAALRNEDMRAVTLGQISSWLS